MQLYDITIAANTTRQLDAPGSYFYYYSGSAGGADSTITMRGLSSGLRIVLKPGQAFRLPRGEQETSWVLTNFSNTATIIGTVIVGDGDITDNRVTGSVEVIDGGKARSLSGSAFAGAAYVGGVAGQYSHAQLWNPAGSGKNIVVEQMLISASSAGPIDVGFNAVALTTLIGNGTCKRTDLAVSASQTRYQNAAAPIAVTGFLAGIFVQTNALETYKFTEPLIVTPGYGLMLRFLTLAGALNASFEFFEESI